MFLLLNGTIQSVRIRAEFTFLRGVHGIRPSRPRGPRTDPLGQLGRPWHLGHVLKNFARHENQTNSLVGFIFRRVRPLHQMIIVS